MSDAPAVLAAIVAVNKAIAEQGIAKGDRNQAQNFAFRGVDRVYDAIAGPMAEHGLFSTSEIITVERSERASRGGGVLFLVYLTVKYTFWCASDGSSVSTTVVAEAMDSGDKATAKAMSVAHRTALLQLSTAPVNPSEPDADTYDVAPPEPRQERVMPPPPDPGLAERRDRVRDALMSLPAEQRAAVLAWAKENEMPAMNALTIEAEQLFLNHIAGVVEAGGPGTEPFL